MKFSREVMPLKVTSFPYFFSPIASTIPNYGLSNSWGGCNTSASQCGAIEFFVQIDLQRMDNMTTSVWIVVVSDKVFKYGHHAKYWGYVWTNTEWL
jgi:hypothetical protein